MKKALALILCLVMLLGVFPMSAAFAEGDTISGSGTADTGISNVEEKTYANATIDQDFAEDRVIVVLKHNVSDMKKTPDKKMFGSVKVTEVEDLTSISKYGNTKSADELPLLNKDNFHQILLLKLPSKDKKAVLEAIEEIEKLDDVLYVEPDYVIHMDPLETAEAADPVDSVDSVTVNDHFYYLQWGLKKIQADKAWNITTGNNTVKVGVIDSGITKHPDLKDNLVAGYDFEHNNNNANDPVSDHGTHVAGIIGACANNGEYREEGIVGVAWHTKLVPLQIDNDLKVSDFGVYTSAIDSAISFSIGNNIPILNVSLKWARNSLYYSFQNYNGLLVVSAGNDNDNLDNVSSTYINIPALSNVIIVGSSSQSDTKSEFSNYGAKKVHLFAPGEEILSCAFLFSDYTNYSYERKSGTSMAAPHVAGVAALIKSIRPDLSAAKIKNLILNNVDKVSALSGKCTTGGRLNAYKAVMAAKVVDVPSNAYYYDAVLWAYADGITAGTDATHFSPGSTITRAEVVTFLWKAMGKPTPKNRVSPFSDVKPNSTGSKPYYYNAVIWAAENGITTGYGDGTFKPNKTCNRAQIIMFIWRAKGSPRKFDTPFSDVTSGMYYYDPVRWGIKVGLFTYWETIRQTENQWPAIKTWADNKNYGVLPKFLEFTANAPCTRALTVTLLYRAFAC